MDQRAYFYLNERGPGPMCQPSEGLISAWEFRGGKGNIYHDRRVYGMCVYNRALTAREISGYELIECEEW